jgi:hypothetical protein
LGIFDVSGQPSIVAIFVFENNFVTLRLEKSSYSNDVPFLKWYQAGNSL